jgi:uncharacterized membrane protein (DUF485 family)
MSDGTAIDADRSRHGTADGGTDLVDWTRIERSPEFRELTARRHRFIAAAAGVTFATFGIYLGLATYATGFMGTTVGGVPIAWLAAMSQVLLTWLVTRAYLRKADREFAPLEQRVAERAGARFTRSDEFAEAHADADGAPIERSAR